MTVDSLPQARVVRKAGQLMAPPPRPPSDETTWLGGHLRTGLTYAIGLWPLTCVVLLMFGFLLLAGRTGP
jgi:hypothetical protein